MGKRSYQVDAVNSIFSYFGSNTGNPVVAMPTGTGKSHVIADFIFEVLQRWPTQRFLMLTHVKELIKQNAEKIQAIWPAVPLGLYSAGLKQKDNPKNHNVIFGGIASVIKAVELFGHIDLLLIDECHLLNPRAETMYAELIKALKKVNPFLKVIGFTATPWRMGQGHITDGGVFTDVCIDMTGVAAFNWFINQGYLTRLIPRPTELKIDLTGVGMDAHGDFAQGQLQRALDKQEITQRALYEAMQYGQYRRKWLVFCAGVEHADHTGQMLNQMGIRTAIIHSRTENRDDEIRAYKRGEYRAATNNNVLTTGFDDPEIDFIVMLRPTMSPGLWVQMLGRGTRPYYVLNGADNSILDTVEGRFWAMANGGKQNCLVMDFAGNTERLGPINDPQIPEKKGGGRGSAPIKICKTERLKQFPGYAKIEGCGNYNHTMVKNCEACGAEFDFAVKIKDVAGLADLVASDNASDAPNLKWYDVEAVQYTNHTGPKAGNYIRATYWCGKKKFMDNVFIDEITKKNFLGHKAKGWWLARYKQEPEFVPENTQQAMMYANNFYLKEPKRIQILHKPGQDYPEIWSYEYE